ncbi:MAG: hypothetical protein IT200_10610 [Thermoleophilia bacterium]|nr:hypothetical protein [Thermoleophilia bacterium]
MGTAEPREVLSRVLRRTGLAFPRGVVGEEVAALAAALETPGTPPQRLDRLVADAAEALWPELAASTAAALRMHRARAVEGDAGDLEVALGWAETDDPGNPLARALVVRAAQELAASLARAERILAQAEPSVAGGGRGAAVAAARAVGAAAVALLDLDPEDYAPEIAEYVEAGEDGDALDRLTRRTGDIETRAWAREALRVLGPRAAPRAGAAARELASEEPPEDPAEDAVWVPVMLALVEEAFERALAAGNGADAAS